MKRILITSIVGVVISVARAGLVLFGSGMSTVPRFGLLDLTVAMAPTLISAVLSWIGAYQSRTKPVRAGYPAAFIAILLIWLATFALLCVTYIDMNAPYRY